VGDESSSGLRTVAVVVIVMLIGLIIGVRELIEKYQKEKVVAGEVKVSPLVTPPVEPQPAPEKPASGEKAATEVAKADATKPESDKSDDPKPQEEKSQEDKPQEDKPQVQAEVTPSQGIPRALEAPKEAPKILPATAAKSANEAKPTKTAQAKPSANEIKPAANEAKPVAAAPAPTAAAKPEATESAATDAAAAKASPKPASVIKATTNEIILEALDKVEIRFNLDGQSKRVSLAPTQVHTVRADEPVTFDFSDGGAVNIILNGHERGPAGDLGKPKQVKIP
jgi:cell division protein FtsN